VYWVSFFYPYLLDAIKQQHQAIYLAQSRICKVPLEMPMTYLLMAYTSLLMRTNKLVVRIRQEKLPVLPISPFVESYGKSFTDSSGRYKLPFGSLNYAPNIQCIRIHFEKQGLRDTTISKTVDITLKIKPPYDTVDVDMVMKKK
jgi:hypothetical protein